MALLFSACSSPSPSTTPITKEAALVRITEQLAALSPVLKQTLEHSPVRRFHYVDKSEVSEAKPLEEAALTLSESPDLLNTLTETTLIAVSTGSTPDKAIRIDQLKALLQTHPNLDLGWLWLSSLQQDYTQAEASLSKAIALNGQVGYYYRRRALLYSLLKNYSAAERDSQQALKLYHDRTKVYSELADTYAMMEDDQRFAETSDLRLAELQSQLARIEKTNQRDWMQQDSIRRLREEIGYGHLSKAMHFIERRNQPAIGCVDLAKAATYGVEEATALQKRYCR
ncbi:tetratricopeptide repeat protein [Hymenobacter cellulosilyticus]|uniref:Tetratricopeptide repeat protein n=1 Tax=Hymenobacter cellulosilyticus TaxID=2932248 RepID=A0A8T9PZY5_9BACT|nr:hypothetical protein [Hymenobacter cellulosilyticus]UOQ70764.1 hypothetical protein MUN79_18985 [Hymenobacter cellulosilyticus]